MDFLSDLLVLLIIVAIPFSFVFADYFSPEQRQVRKAQRDLKKKQSREEK